MSLACTVGVVIVALAACGGDGENGDEGAGTGTDTAATTPSGPVVATVDVTETEYELDPQNPRISKPGVVEFRVTNAGRIAHALEVEAPGGEVETDTIEPGGEATLRADLSRPGRYVWYCPVGDHEQRGMKGTITVAGGGSGAGADGSGRGDSGRGRDSGKGRDDSASAPDAARERRDSSRRSRDDSGANDSATRREDGRRGRDGAAGGVGSDAHGGY